MEFIVIHKRNGSTINTFNRVESAEQVKEFLGQDVVNISLKSPKPIIFDIGDWIEVFGEVYTLNLLPHERKANDRLFEYDVRFEGVQYDLIKVQVLDIDDTGFATGANFSLMANLDDYAQLIIRNLNRVYGANKWLLGEVLSNTDHILNDFTNSNCLEVLQSLADQYDTHFWIERIGNQFKLNVTTIDAVLPDTFYYGRHKGLYNLERTNVSDKNIITRLFAFGGTTNIPPNYRGGSIRLKLPVSTIPSEAQPYITDAAAVAEYGITEGAINFEEIYPKRTGAITDISTDRLVFFDASMPFDLNDQLLPGLTAKVNFKTGDLAGYAFEVTAYDTGLKQFTINPYTDERGFVFPSIDTNAFRAAVGDQYVLTDIKMPQSYIDAAEAELYAKAVDHLAVVSVPAVQWSLEIDSNFIRSKEAVQGQIVHYFQIGHFLNVIDTDLRISGKSQIIGFTRNILKPYEYRLTVSEQFVNKRNIQRRLGVGYDFDKVSRQITGRVQQIVNNNLNTQIQNTTTLITTNIHAQSNFGGREW